MPTKSVALYFAGYASLLLGCLCQAVCDSGVSDRANRERRRAALDDNVATILGKPGQ